ncbi:hypothetical protein M9H77_08931 [Catharanthus roseus]|uniref:Uncharacterized protein n=1 Tax=Catharanthus roseus TaxID=4058 RepID=A0ACC0BZK4_CATRO|nr:hypothetical protein M9H77_08931 [Catharanthus roseus]
MEEEEDNENKDEVSDEEVEESDLSLRESITELQMGFTTFLFGPFGPPKRDARPTTTNVIPNLWAFLSWCLLIEKTTKRNENNIKHSKNDTNEANGITEEDLPPKRVPSLGLREMVHESKKKRAHLETSTPPALASIPPRTTASPTVMLICSISTAATLVSDAHFYSFFIICCGESSRPTLSSSVRPPRHLHRCC